MGICKFPRIIHMIYFPWDRNQRLKKNEQGFNKRYYRRLQKDNPDWDIHLWTLGKTQNFVQENYPGLWDEIWEEIDRPAQAVDFFRWLVVYHYGGMYLQYGSNNLVPFESLIPTVPYPIRLFTEAVLTEEFSEEMKAEPIRGGRPEELLRISSAIFSAYPENRFIWHVLDKMQKNLKLFKVLKDYDVLYITGNAMLSEAYHEYSSKDHIELTNKTDTDNMIKFKSFGSWRTDKGRYSMLDCFYNFLINIPRRFFR